MPVISLLPLTDDKWSWYVVDHDGVEHDLTNGNYIVEFAVSGALMPPVELQSRELPLSEGDYVQGVRVGARPLDIPIAIYEDSKIALIERHEALLSWIDPSRGPVTIKVQRPDGDVREILCYYQGGLEGNEVPEQGVHKWFRGVMSFRAHRSYWQDAEDQVVEFTAQEVTGIWSDYFTPFLTSLSSDEILEVKNVTNSGSAPAWPRWVITGPCVNPVLRNMTTGRELGFEYTLLAGESLTIDTAPLVENPVYDAGGNNRYSALTSGSSLWELPRGTSRIQVEMDGLTDDSSVQLLYRRRWHRR